MSSPNVTTWWCAAAVSAALCSHPAAAQTVPIGVVAPNSIQMFDELLVGRSGVALLVRPGQPVWRGVLDGDSGYREPNAVVPMADGGFLTLDNDLPNSAVRTRCQLRRFGPALELRWHQQLEITAADASSRSACLRAAEDGAGNLWLPSSTHFTRLSAEGVVRAVMPFGADLRRLEDLAGDPTGAGLFVVGEFGEPQNVFTRQAGAARLDGAGQYRWQWLESRSEAYYSRVVTLDHGGVALEGAVLETAQTSRMTVLNADGQLRWRYPHRSGELLVHAYGPGGQVLTYTRTASPGNRGELTLRTAEGAVQGSAQRDGETGTLLYGVALRANRTGYLVTELYGQPGFNLADPVVTRLQRLDPELRPLWSQRRSTVNHYSTLGSVLRSDGSVLYGMELRIPNEAPVQRVEVLAATDGASAEVALASAASDRMFIQDAAEAADGTLALLINDALGQQRYQLRDPGGRVVWQRQDARYGGVSLEQAGQSCATRMASFTEGLTVECRDLATGNLLGQPLSFGPETGDFAQQVVPGGGRSLLIQGNGGGIAVAIVGPDLNLVRRASLGFAPDLVRYAPSGDLVMRQGGRLVRVDPMGFSRILQNAGGDAYPLSRGETLLSIGASQAEPNLSRLRLLDRSDAVRSTVAFGVRFADSPIELLETDDAVLVSSLNAAPLPASALDPRSGTLLALDRRDGRVLWRRDLNIARGAIVRRTLVLDAARGRVLLLSPLRQALDVRAFDLVTGATLTGQVIDAPAGRTVSGPHVQTQSRTFRVETQRQDGGTDAADFLLSARHAFDAPATPGLEHPGRTGAWYDPASAGQGLLVDVVPGSRTLYAAWFTQDSSPDAAPLAAPARLRWYSLQGDYTDGARSLTLDVLENRGGHFAEPPVTSARVIGAASLEFTGCGSAVLDLSMDEPGRGPLQQRIALRALAVRDPACRTPVVTMEAHGFSSAASGSWLDPDTGGQGLVVSVRPPGPSTGDGLFFAGWFHYDPAGQVDDAGQQAWLSLQGDLAQAVDGRAEVGIFRTLGSYLAGPSTPNTQRIGTATIQLTGCDRMTVQYRFDANERAAPYGGLAGRLQLGKLGGCSR